jgi:predicted PurR-regulated permease PerM
VAAPEALPSERRAIRFEIAPKTIGWALLAVGSVWLLMKLWSVVLLVVIALVIVGTLNPAINALERRGMRRSHALLLVFLAMVAGFVGLVLLTVPPLVSQLMAVVADAPENRDAAIRWLRERELLAPLATSLEGERFDAMIERAGDTLLGYSTRLLALIGYGITCLFLAFYLLADGNRAQGAVYLFVPRRYHLRLSRILLNLETIVGGYMRGQLITSGCIFVFTYALLMIFQVPNALSIAVFAAVVDLIPIVGGVLAVVPASLMALQVSPTATIVIAIALTVYQEFESRILLPRVYGRVLRLAPAMVVLALLIGAALLGVIGALLALPIAAGLQMMIKELRLGLPGDDTDDTALRERDEQAEEEFHRLSAGAPAAQAAAIATSLAREIRAQDAPRVVDEKEAKAAAAEVPVTGGHEDEGSS